MDNVFLLERIDCRDETLEALPAEDRDEEAIHIVCNVISKLMDGARNYDGMRELKTFAERSLEIGKYVGEGRVQEKDKITLCEDAQEISADIVARTKDRHIALHGDLHHGNILYSPERGWLAIDPKGINGPAEYEYAAASCNPYMMTNLTRNKDVMVKRVDIVSEHADLEKELILKFAYLHAIQCGSWSLSKPDQDAWFGCAQTLRKLM